MHVKEPLTSWCLIFHTRVCGIENIECQLSEFPSDGQDGGQNPVQLPPTLPWFLVHGAPAGVWSMRLSSAYLCPFTSSHLVDRRHPASVRAEEKKPHHPDRLRIEMEEASRDQPGNRSAVWARAVRRTCARGKGGVGGTDGARLIIFEAIVCNKAALCSMKSQRFPKFACLLASRATCAPNLSCSCVRIIMAA